MLMSSNRHFQGGKKWWLVPSYTSSCLNKKWTHCWNGQYIDLSMKPVLTHMLVSQLSPSLGWQLLLLYEYSIFVTNISNWIEIISGIEKKKNKCLLLKLGKGEAYPI